MEVPSDTTGFDLEQLMLALLPPAVPLDQRPTLTESDIRNISGALKSTGQHAWGQIPRIYAILRVINQLPSIRLFLTDNLTDVWFPFTHRTLPGALTPTARNAFINAQRLVLTKALDLEREDGRHRHYSSAADVPLVKLRELGRGGNGAVDQVLSTVSRKIYARKLLPRGLTFRKNKDVLRDFEKELAVLKKLSHEHIIQLVGSYTDPRYVGILMLPVADCNLAQYLLKPSAAQNDSVLRCAFGCLAAALNYLHQNEVRHKDIKPQNILIKDHSVLLTDFGISQDWGNAGHTTTIGSATGTPKYCAPEVAASSARNTSSDVWSLGCVFLEIWTALCGETQAALTTFLHTHGSRSMLYHSNNRSVESWSDNLTSKHCNGRTKLPGQWIRNMLAQEPNQRWNAHTLFEAIFEASEDHATDFVYMGMCCAHADESAESVDSSVYDPADQIMHSNPVGMATEVTNLPSRVGTGEQGEQLYGGEHVEYIAAIQHGLPYSVPIRMNANIQQTRENVESDVVEQPASIDITVYIFIILDIRCEGSERQNAVRVVHEPSNELTYRWLWEKITEDPFDLQSAEVVEPSGCMPFLEIFWQMILQKARRGRKLLIRAYVLRNPALRSDEVSFDCINGPTSNLYLPRGMLPALGDYVDRREGTTQKEKSGHNRDWWYREDVVKILDDVTHFLRPKTAAFIVKVKFVHGNRAWHRIDDPEVFGKLCNEVSWDRHQSFRLGWFY